MSSRILAAIAAFVCGCGPTSLPADDVGDDDDDGADIDAGPLPPVPGTLTGTVWAPGNALGAVAAGYEIPVANATVYVADASPAPIPAGVYCDRCTEPAFPYVRSDAKG